MSARHVRYLHSSHHDLSSVTRKQGTAEAAVQSIARDYFLMGQNTAGWWVVRDNKTRKGGLFRSRRSAMQYARRESPSQQFVIVYLPEGLEFECR